MSIFELVNELDIQKEYNKFNFELSEGFIYYESNMISFFEYLDRSGNFRGWKERNTCLTVFEYLHFLGVRIDGEFKDTVSLEQFLYYMEFLINIFFITIRQLDVEERKIIVSLIENINLILDKLGYKTDNKASSNRITVNRKDSDLDSIVDEIDIDLSALLISYNDFRIEKDISKKHSILKKIDLYIEEYKKVLKEKDSATYDVIQKIVNNFGINHPIKSDEIKAKDEKGILTAYDDCYKLMIHLIRSVEYSTLKDKYSGQV